MALDRVIDRIAIIRTIRHKAADRTVDLSQDVIDLIGITGILVGQKMGDDHAALRVNRQDDLQDQKLVGL